ncbi:hypothetical protein BAE52_20965 [Pseudomonas sp. EGD-AKN5]|nr:hypothetical protein BAE52_20965 [Pseudomonas sp. EGD-AKN5]
MSMWRVIEHSSGQWIAVMTFVAIYCMTWCCYASRIMAGCHRQDDAVTGSLSKMRPLIIWSAWQLGYSMGPWDCWGRTE